MRAQSSEGGTGSFWALLLPTRTPALKTAIPVVTLALPNSWYRLTTPWEAAWAILSISSALGNWTLGTSLVLGCS